MQIRHSAQEKINVRDNGGVARELDVLKNVGFTYRKDITSVIGLIDAEHKRSGAVLEVEKHMLSEWVSKGHSAVVAVNRRIVAHQAIHVWQGLGLAELRAAVVHPSYRNNGFAYELTLLLMERVRRAPDVKDFVVLKNESANGDGMLHGLGFIEVARGQPDELIKKGLPAELFSIGGNQSWKIFMLPIEEYASGVGKHLLLDARRA